MVWEVDGDLNFTIPPLTIQPLVENSIKHGILPRAEGGTVTIRIQKNPGYYLVEVEDDGVGISERKDSKREGIGLNNINKRIKQLYGERLLIDSAPGRGTRISFKVRLP